MQDFEVFVNVFARWLIVLAGYLDGFVDVLVVSQCSVLYIYLLIAYSIYLHECGPVPCRALYTYTHIELFVQSFDIFLYFYNIINVFSFDVILGIMLACYNVFAAFKGCTDFELEIEFNNLS